MSDEEESIVEDVVTECLHEGIDGEILDPDLLTPDNLDLTPDKYQPNQISSNGTMTFRQLYDCSFEQRSLMNDIFSQDQIDAIVPNDEEDPDRMITINTELIRQNAGRFLEKGRVLLDEIDFPEEYIKQKFALLLDNVLDVVNYGLPMILMDEGKLMTIGFSFLNCNEIWMDLVPPEYIHDAIDMLNHNFILKIMGSRIDVEDNLCEPDANVHHIVRHGITYVKRRPSIGRWPPVLQVFSHSMESMEYRGNVGVTVAIFEGKMPVYSCCNRECGKITNEPFLQCNICYRHWCCEECRERNSDIHLRNCRRL